MVDGWDPLKSPPTDPRPCKSLAQALLLTYFIEQLLDTSSVENAWGSLSGNCYYTQVLRWLPHYRPYKGPEEIDAQSYADQVQLVAAVVMTMSSWGQTQLLPSLFPHEYYFLLEHFASIIYDRHAGLAADSMQVRILQHR